jgi:hypothetical protein
VLKYWRAIAVALLPLALYFIPRESLFEHSHTLCLVHNLTGEECWGCGMTRALASVLYLDFESAWGYHRGVVVVAPLLVWLWVKWIYKELRGVEPRNDENNK